MPRRPCLVCGQLTTGSYCHHHLPALGTRTWRRLRAEVLQRDGHACVECGATTGLEAHHLQPRGQGGTDTLDNLEARCHTCHGQAHRG